MKRVLIITYYWPPSGGAGVQRWLKFAKYLPEFGWEPVIYTPENPEYPVEDPTLEKDVPVDIEILRQPIWEPYGLYRRFIGQKGKRIGGGFVSEKKEPGLLQRISVWIRGNLFIPDARRFWIKPSVRFLGQYLKDSPVDAVISTGPPHSMHLIALELKRSMGIKWIADFRDPWTNIDFYRDLMLSPGADRRHRQMEQDVLKEADLTLTIGYTMTREMEALGAKRVETVTNGYDEDDFPETEVKVDEEFSIAHIGTFSPSRNHPMFWKTLSELKSENSEFAGKLKIRTLGAVDHSVRSSINEHGLTGNWEEIEYVPHEEVLHYQRCSRVLLVCINNTPNATGILPGKFFEYLASGRPILAIGPKESDIGKVLHETKAGMIVEPNDVEGMRESLLYLFKDGTDFKPDQDAINQFSRKRLTERLVGLMSFL